MSLIFISFHFLVPVFILMLFYCIIFVYYIVQGAVQHHFPTFVSADFKTLFFPHNFTKSGGLDL